MTNQQILDMLNNDEIDELKLRLKAEIISEGYSSDEKKRLKAKDTFFKNDISPIAGTNKPFINGDKLVLFNNCCCVETSETDCAVDVSKKPSKQLLEAMDIALHKSIDITKVEPIKVNLRELLIGERAEGYKILKKNFYRPYPFRIEYNESEFNTALVELGFNIIDDNEIPTIYISGNYMWIETSIGKCVVMRIGDSKSDVFTKYKIRRLILKTSETE
jgi:hypothetical protein